MSEIFTINKVLKQKIGDRYYFTGSFPSSNADQITYVPVVEKSKKSHLNEILGEEGTDSQGYQRPGSIMRMNKFSSFLEDNPNRLVPPVLLSARNNCEFIPDDKDMTSLPILGTLKIIDSLAIIDGQHRVGGYIAHFNKYGETRDVHFICFENLNPLEEQEEFRTINNTQVGVPKALDAFLDGEWDSKLAWKLNIDESSPFYGKITRVGFSAGKLFALHSFAKNVKRTFDHGAFLGLSDDERYDAFVRYWQFIADSNTEAWSDIEVNKRTEMRFKLLELTGIIAWSLFAKTILPRVFNTDNLSFDWDELKKMIDYVSEDFDWDKKGRFEDSTGEVGGRKICNILEHDFTKY